MKLKRSNNRNFQGHLENGVAWESMVYGGGVTGELAFNDLLFSEIQEVSIQLRSNYSGICFTYRKQHPIVLYQNFAYRMSLQALLI
jgi:hypothetical protein